MTFLWPWMLLSLLLLPLLAFYFLRAEQTRAARASALGAFGMVRDRRGAVPGRRRHLPVGLALAGMALLLFGLARPQMPLSLPRMEGTVMLTFDVSASMGATDLTPTRMEAAKQAALAFIDEQPETVRIGVLAFSEGGLLVQPPTGDRIDLVAAVDRLEPQAGTSLGQGILAGLNAILLDGAAAAPDPGEEDAGADVSDDPVPTPLPSGSFDDAVILLITDGENMSDPDPLEAAERAADYGVRIHTIGMGSAAGSTIEVDGITLATRLDEELLRTVSNVTNGSYFRAESSEELRSIYTTLASDLTLRTEPTEITAVLAGLGMLLLLAAGSLSLVWFGRLPL